MGHKTRADRQREAQIRMATSEVPRALARVKDAMQLVVSQGPGHYESDSLKYAVLSLHAKWFTLHSHTANGMIYAVLNGGDGTSWVSTPMDVHEIIKWFIDQQVRRYEKRMERMRNPKLDARDRWLMGID